MSSQHEIRLTVPAQPEFVRLARVTASGLATRLGFNIDDVDDLRLALDELCHSIVEPPIDGTTLELIYKISDDSLTISGVSHGNALLEVSTEAVNSLSKQILTALVDEHSAWDDDEGRHFTLTKRRVDAA